MRHVLFILIVFKFCIGSLSQTIPSVSVANLIPHSDFNKSALSGSNILRTPAVDSTPLKQMGESRRQINIRTTLDFFFAFTGLHFMNTITSNEKSKLQLYCNFTGDNRIRTGQFLLTSYYNNEFGATVYADSFALISEDSYVFKNDLSFVINESKFAVNFSVATKSQFYKHYDYRKDTLGNLERYLLTNYLSPGYINYTGGFKWLINDQMSMDFGLINAQRTRIRDKSLFISRMSDNLYGVLKEKGKISEFGISLSFNSSLKEIYKSVFWENFSQFAVSHKNIKSLNHYQFNIANAFHYLFLKYLRLTLRTKINYDYTISLKPKMVNSITFGFYLNNKVK